ncbi:MAG: hypothetical protein IPK26_12445 [Planctomycetes bacterium]|nr:hypothetical protein [Planctomycetota bacterium]
MPIGSAALVFALVVVAASGQDPVPAGEVRSGDWSPVEAQALTWLQQRRTELQTKTTPMPREGVGIRQYRILFFRAEEQAIVPAAELGPGTPWFALAWPTTADATAQRGLLLHADGTTLVCELESGSAIEPAAELALAKGSVGTFADVLRQPGTGEQGHLWLWLDQVSARDEILFVDADGKPLANVQVQVVPQGQGYQHTIASPRPLPIAQARADTAGSARLHGPRCGATALLLGLGDDAVRAAGVRLESRNERLVVVIQSDALVPRIAFRNESAAIATLRNIASAQMQCLASSVIDVDRDGKGEFGGFLELTGTTVVRGSESTRISPPVLSKALAKAENGVVTRAGYCFQVWLPGKDGVPIAADGADAAAPIDAGLAEQHFLVLAWPIERGKSGVDAFLVTQAGVVLRRTAAAEPFTEPLSPRAVFPAGKIDLTTEPDATAWQPVQ